METGSEAPRGQTFFRVAGPAGLILLVIAGVMGYWYAWIVLALVIVVGIAYHRRGQS